MPKVHEISTSPLAPIVKSGFTATGAELTKSSPKDFPPLVLTLIYYHYKKIRRISTSGGS